MLSSVSLITDCKRLQKLSAMSVNFSQPFSFAREHPEAHQIPAVGNYGKAAQNAPEVHEDIGREELNMEYK